MRSFLGELDKVWAECLRILVPGGRIACVVGDVCISRRSGGRHHVLPLGGDIQVRARRIGFDNLNPIRWLKVTNIRLEASRSSRFLGKPNLPNGVIKNDVETILFFRKPSGYRRPSKWQEEKSFIPTDDYVKWFGSVWTDISGQLRSSHPSPFPLEIATRLIRMFSFVGDTVVDPFAGSGTTAVAALQTGRNSISVDIEPGYVEIMEQRLREKGILSPQLQVDMPHCHIAERGMFVASDSLPFDFSRIDYNAAALRAFDNYDRSDFVQAGISITPFCFLPSWLVC